jgi:hypothetical protein
MSLNQHENLRSYHIIIYSHINANHLLNKGEEHIAFPENLGSQHNVFITDVSGKQMML